MAQNVASGIEYKIETYQHQLRVTVFERGGRMASDDERHWPGLSASGNKAMQRIADVLGCPVETFVEGARDPTGTRDLSELVSIWCEMDNDAKRSRLLEFARQLTASS